MIRGALPTIGRAAPRPHALALAVSAAFASSVYANPTGPSVTAGGATFSVSGNTLTITNAPGTVINWQQFSIQKDEVTRFLQQHGGSAVLNRVVGGDPSVILGLLQSKLPDGSIGGRVFLINPSGITFGRGAIIDVGGFVASTLKLSDSDFLSGRMMFSGTGAEGAIRVEPASAQEKAGTIRTPEGGHVYLIAPQVENSGVITTPKGEVVIAAGKTVELVNARTPDIRVEYTADGKVTNAGEIVAASGHVGIYGTLIKNSGVVSASRAEVGDGGRIVFKALKDITLDATSKIEASGAKGGSITIQAETGTLLAQGRIEAKGEEAKGGEIQLLAKQVAVHDATVDASGKTGGGTVLIGGDYQGKNAAIQNAQRTIVTPSATIRADATGNGDGGKVIVWADGDTRFGGTITTKGGPDGGDGGFVEVSGKEQLAFAGMVDTTAPKGVTGTLLLDPGDITITNNASVAFPTGPQRVDVDDGDWFFDDNSGAQSISSGTVVAILNNTNVNFQSTGNITFADNATITYANSPARDLTMTANESIVMGGGANITSTGGALNVTFIADNDGNKTGGIKIGNGTTTAIISTNGGNITLGGSGSNMAYGSSLTDSVGVHITKANLNAGSGHITIRGRGQDGDTRNAGVMLTSSVLQTSSGNITIQGTGGNGTNNDGIVHWGNEVSGAGGNISTDTGTVSLVGQGGNAASATQGHGIVVFDGASINSTGTVKAGNGSINLTGTGGQGDTAMRGIVISGGSVTSVAADINIVGTGGNGTSAIVGVVLGANTTPGEIKTTGTGINAGNINITGTAGTGNGTSSMGFALSRGAGYQNATISTVDGHINITGTSTSTGSDSAGIRIGETGGNETSISSSGAGSITLTGSGAGTNLGIEVLQSATTNHNIGASTGTGGVTLIADSMNLNHGAIRNAGIVTLKPFTTSRAIQIGSTNDTTALALNSTEIGNIFANNIVIGSSSQTANLSIDSSTTFAHGNVKLQTGANIAIASSADVTFTNSGAHTVKLEAGDTIVLGTGANIRSTGGGALDIVLNADRDVNQSGSIVLNSGSKVLSAGGKIELAGGNTTDANGYLNSFAYGTATNNQGVRIHGASVESTGGNISIRGHAFVGAGDRNNGVAIINNGTTAGALVSSGTGNITIVGGADETNTTSHGVAIDAAYLNAGASTANVASTSGTITIDGQGGGNSSLGVGVRWTGATVQSETGNIVMTGVGHRGVSISEGAKVFTGGSGSISITGTGTTSGDEGAGVGMFWTNTSVTTVGGNITIVGVGSSNGSNRADGVTIAGTTVATQTGTISITGTGGGAAGSSDGIRMDTETGGQGAAIYASGSGNVVLTGTAGLGGAGIRTKDTQGNGQTVSIGSAAMTGDITLIADSMNMSTGSSQVRTAGGGTITIRPKTAARDIELGTGAADSTTLGLDNTEVARLFANNVVIGGATHAGNISVVGAAAFTNVGGNGTLTLQAGNTSSTTGHILFNNALSTAGNVGVSTAMGNVTFTQTGVTGLTSGSGKSVSVSAANGSITSTNANTDISTGGNAGSVTLAARDGISGVNLDTGNVSATATNGSVSVTNTQATVLTGGNISGDYTFTTTGDITQTAAVTANGTLTFNAGTGGNVTLTQAANDFNTVVIASANDVDIVDTNSITLGTSTVLGNLTVTAGGNIGQSGAITANTSGKIATFNAGANGDISLGNTSNNFYEVRLIGRQVTVNTAGTLRVGTSTIYGNLSIDPITAGSDLLIVGDETFAGGAPGTFNFVAAGNVIVTGSGNIGTITQPVNVILNSNNTGAGGRVQIGDGGANGTARINTGGGNLTIGGGSSPTTTAATGVAGAVEGVLVNNASISTGAGTISMIGNSTLGDGVKITDNSSVNSAAALSIDGRSTSSTGNGVTIAGQSNVTVTGAANLTIFGSNSNSTAVQLVHAGTRVATEGSGNISITGIQSNAAAPGPGVSIWGPSGVGPTVVSTGSGNIQIIGQGGTDQGINILVSTVEATGTGSIALQGNAAGSGASTRGVSLSGTGTSRVSTASGNISIDGDASAATNGTGVYLDGSAGTALVSSTSGTIQIVGAGNGTGFAIQLTGGDSRVSTTGGSVELRANTIDLSTANRVAAGGTITVRPVNPAATIQLGAGAADSNSTPQLGLTDVEVGKLFAANVVVGGSSQAGNINVVGAANFANMAATGTLTLQAGNVASTAGHIDIGNTVTTAGNISATSANGSIAFNTGSGVIGLQAGAGKTITVSAANGAITSTNGFTNAADANAGTTGSVSLFAKSGIGTTGNAIVFEAASISANNTTSGDVVLQTSNSITLGGGSAIVNGASGGGIDITVTNATADITIGIPTLAGGTSVSTNNGNVVLTAGNSVIFAQGAGNVGISSGTANTTLTAGTANTGGSIVGQAANTDDVRARALTATANSTSGEIGHAAALQSNLALTTDGALTLSAGGNINVSEAGALPLANASVSGNAPYITLTSIAGPITVGSGNFGVTTGNLTLVATSGSIVAGTGNLLANNLVLHANGTSAGVGASGSPVLSDANTVTGTGNAGGFQVSDQTGLSVGNVSSNGNIAITTLGATGDLTITGDVTYNGSGGHNATFASANNVLMSGGANVRTLGSALNITLNSDTDDNGGGIQVGDGVTTAQILSGGGNILLGGGLNAGNKAIGTTGTANVGVYVDRATLNAGAGSLTLRGQGATGGGDGASGVYIYNRSTLAVTGAGDLTLDGAGGGTGNTSMGVRIRGITGGVNTTVSSSGAGNIIITGTGATNTASGSDRHGVMITDDRTIVESTGSGNITITGFGGNGGGAGSGVVVGGSQGDFVRTTSTGKIIVNGTGGNAAGAYGVWISNGASIESSGTTAATITITGTGNAAAGGAGVFIDGSGNGAFNNSRVATGAADVTITGVGGGGSTDSDGVRLRSDVSGLANSGAQILSSAGGNIIVTGSTVNAGAYGLRGVRGNLINPIGGTGAGDITLVADSIDLGATAANVSVTTGGARTISVRPLTPTRAIELGSTNDSAALALTSIEAGQLFANNVVIGGANQAGSISVTGAASFSGMGNAGTLTLQTGNVASTTGLISVGNTITAPGNVTLTTANGSIAFTQGNTAVGVQSGAGKTITISAANGAVTSANGSDVVDANTGVTGAVVISAKSGIGATGNAVVLDTNNVTATNTISGEVVIINRNALSLGGGSQITQNATNANLSVTVTSGNLTIADTVTANGGAISLSAGNGNVIFATNNGVTGVTTTGNSVTITAGAAIIGNANGNTATTDVSGTRLSVNSANGIGAANALRTQVSNLAISNTTDGNVRITNTSASVNLDSTSVGGGNLTLTNTGHITQTGNIAMGTGTTATFGADATSDITLGNATNDFATVAVTSGNVVSIKDANNVILGTSAFNGSLTLEAVAGSTTVAANSTVTRNSTGTGNLNLLASSDVLVSGNVTIGATGGALNVVLNSDTDNNGGGIKVGDGVTTTSISSNGGSILMGGGASAANKSIGTAATSNTGVLLANATLTSGTGNITLLGAGANVAATVYGVDVANTSLIQANGGVITLTGNGGTDGQGTGVGVRIGSASIVETIGAGMANISGGGSWGPNATGVIVNGTVRSTSSGTLSIVGAGGGSGGSPNDGVLIQSGGLVHTSGSGTLSVFGVAGTSGSAGVSILAGGNVASTGTAAANINIGGEVSLPGTSTAVGVQIDGRSGTAVVYSSNAPITINGVGGNMGTPSGTFFLGSGTNASITSAGAGAITITGRTGNSAGAGIFANGGFIVSGASATGNITLLGDSINMPNGGANITSGGAVVALTSNAGSINSQGPISSGGGNVNITSATSVNQGGNVTSGTGAVNVTANTSVVLGNITTTGGAVTVVADADTNNSGGISAQGNISSGAGDITLGGLGSNRAVGDATSANFGVLLTGTVTTTSGNIVVRGAGNPNASGNGHGVRVFNTSGITTGGGSITLDGMGGNGGAGVSANANITAGSGGNITITGIGGNGASGTFQHGVTVANATVQADGGHIVISGNGGGGANGAIGVQLTNTTVQINGGGNILVHGNAGTTTGGTTSGISLQTGSVIQSSGTGLIELRGNGGQSTTGTTTGVGIDGSTVQSNGSISIVGYGGNTSAGTTASANGIQLTNGAAVRTALAGNISLTGTGGISSGTANAGGISFTDNSYAQATGTGDIVVSGTGNTAASGHARGVSLRPISTGNGGSILAASGNITITGTGGTGAGGAEAIYLQGANTTIGGGSGNVTLIGDTMNLGSAPGVTISTSGLATVRPLTPTRRIELGTGADEAGTLALSNAEVGVFTANNVVIGGSLQAGNISVVGSAPFSNMGAGGTLTLSAANASSATGHITFNNAVSTAGNVVVTTAVGNISFTQSGVTAITTGSGKVATISAGNGAISTSNANIDVDTGAGGNVVVTAKSGIGTIADPIDLSTSNVSANNTTSGDVSIRNTRSLVLGTSGLVVNTAPTGNIQVIVSGTNNDLTVNQTVSVAGGSVILNAGNSVIFDQGTANGVSAGANVTLTAGNQIIGGTTTANDVVATRVTITAGNGIGAANAIETRVSNLAVTNTTSGNVNVTNFAGVNIDTANVVNGNFSLVTGGAITQSGNVTVTNLASFNAGVGDITLNGSALTNNFGTLTFLGGNVAITENSSMTLAGTSNAGGTLALTSAGTMNQAASSTILVSGNATLTANLSGVAQDITFNSTTNDFKSATSVGVGNNATIVDANDFNIGASTISGNANFTALAGNITTAGAISLGGTTHNVRAEGAGTQGDVTFSHAFTQNNAATGTFVIEANRSITFATGASVTGNSGGAGGILHVTLNADRDANSAGAISMVSGTSITSAGGNIVLGGGSNPAQNAAVGVGSDIHGVSLNGATLTAGAGHVTVRGQSLVSTADARGVQLINNADIVTTSGNIAVIGTANAGASGTAGVYLSDAGTTITTANGAISITGGHTGTATGSTNRGVWAQAGAVVQATDAGTATITGTGANTSGTGNDGVFLTGAGTKVSTANGALTIVGTGHGNGGVGIGVHLATDALVTTTGAGAIVLSGTSNATGGSNNYGFFVTSGADVVSAGSGNVTITGVAGNGSSTDIGVALDTSGSRISAVSGHVDITGTGNGTGSGAAGIRLSNDFQIETTGSGNITLTGAGSVAGTGEGVNILSGSDIRASGTGAIRITGTGSNGSSGIATSGGGTFIGGAAAGDILLRSLGGNISTDAVIQTPAQVTFNSVAGVSQTGGNIVGNGNLHVLGTGTFALTSATNNVSLLAANIAGNLAYTDAGSFAIGQITSNSGAALTTTSGISTGTGNVVTLYSPGTVTQTTNDATSRIVTSSMELLGTGGNYQLTNITNNVGTLAANTGTISLAANGALTIATVNGNSGILTTGAVTFNNAGLLSINADVTANGGLAQVGAGDVTITGPRAITTNGNAVSFATAVTLAGGANTVTIDTTGNGASPNGANLTFTSTVNASTGNTERLTVNTGNAGDILFNGAVGGTVALGNLTISNAHHVTFNSNVTTATLNQSAGTGNTIVFGNLTTTVNGVSITTDRIQFNGSVTTPATQDIFLSAQNGVVQAGGAFSTDELLLLGSNNFSLAQPGNNIATTIAANITGSLSFTNGANITVGTVTNNAGSATGITTNGGNVTLVATGSVNVSQQINAGAGNVTLTANGGSVFGSGTITGAALTANATGGAVNLPVAAVSGIDAKATAGNITITNTKASVDITGANASGLVNISTSNAMVVSGNVIAGAGSNVTLTSGTAGSGGMNIGANITGPAGITLTVQTDEGILHHSGGAITATNNAIVLQADEMWLQGAANSISAGTANITLKPYQAGDAIQLGATGAATTGNASALELSTSELNTLSTANTLVIGGAGQNGSIQVIGAATVSNSANLLVSTTAQVNVNTGGNLAYNGTGNVTVSAGNQITGGGTLTAANLTLTSVNGIGTTAAPVHLGRTTNLTATNNTSGQIAIQADVGDLTLLGQVTNNGAGGVSLSTVDGSINTGTANFTSGGGVTLVANATGTTARTLTVGTGGITANGVVQLASADDMTINGNVVSNNGNVFLAAGRSTGLAAGLTSIIPVAATEPSDTDGGIALNAGVNSGTGNITIYATEGVVQPTGNSGTAGLVGGRLTVRTFNDSPAVGIINLQNNTPVIGNNVSNVTLEARLANDTTAPAEPSAYAASNIDYRSISSLVISGVGTAADYTAVATTQNIDLTALNIQAKNLTLIASAGDVNVNVPIKNAQINLGNPGGSLNLLANGNVNINASSSNQGVSIGQRIGTKTDDTHVGEPLVQYFDHDLKLIASGNIKIEGGIWITGDLNLRADASLAEAANRFATPAAGDGLGGVTITNTSTTDVLEVRARNLTVGASSGGSNFPVQFLRITAGSGTTTTVNNNVRTDAVLRAGIPTSETATATSNTVTGGSMQVLVREDLQLTAGNTWRAQSSGATVRNSAIAAILGVDLHICGVVGGVVTCQPSSQSYNAANFITLKGGTAVADNTGGGGAIASASALILGSTTVSISHGGTLHLIGGTANSFGSAQASSLAVIDPTSPLQIFTGGNVILEAGQTNGGLNAAAGARIINEGFIQINLGSGAGQYNYNGTLLGPGVILIGGPGTGAFSGSPIPQQVFSFASNPISISGGGLVLHQLGSGFADASILSGVNLFDESLLSYIIFAANEETRAARIRRGLGEGDDLGAPACK